MERAQGMPGLFQVEDAETFAAVDEPGADPLVIAEEGVVLPVGGLVKVYGGGGVGKTTLVMDWAVHFAAGATWLDKLVPARPLRVLILGERGAACRVPAQAPSASGRVERARGTGRFSARGSAARALRALGSRDPPR